VTPGSPAAAPPVDDVAGVVLRVASSFLPRTPADQLEVVQAAEGTFLVVHQAPEPDVCWKVRLGVRTAVLQRADPTTRDVLPGAPLQEVGIPGAPVAPQPVHPKAQTILVRSSKALSDRLTQTTTACRVPLQHVAATVEEETRALLAGLRGVENGTDALTRRVAAGLGAYLDFTSVLADAEALLATHKEAQHEQHATLQATRATGTIMELAQLQGAERQGAELRTTGYSLQEAVAEARLFRDAFRAAATILAQAGAQAAAEYRAQHVGAQLMRIKTRLFHLREDALQVDPQLVGTLEIYSRKTGQAIQVPPLQWSDPMDAFAPPVVG
jgi:hypothetical protein